MSSHLSFSPLGYYYYYYDPFTLLLALSIIMSAFLKYYIITYYLNSKLHRQAPHKQPTPNNEWWNIIFALLFLLGVLGFIERKLRPDEE